MKLETGSGYTYTVDQYRLLTNSELECNIGGVMTYNVSITCSLCCLLYINVGYILIQSLSLIQSRWAQS